MKTLIHHQQAVKISHLRIKWSHQNICTLMSNRFWILLNDSTCLFDLKVQSSTWPIENRIRFQLVIFNHFRCHLIHHRVMKDSPWKSNTINLNKSIVQKLSFQENLQVRVSLNLQKNPKQQTKMSRSQTRSNHIFKTPRRVLESLYASRCIIKSQSWLKGKKICKRLMILRTVLPWSILKWSLKITLNRSN